MIELDGLSLTTLLRMCLRTVAAVEIYKPIALEAEGGISSTWDLNYITIGWAEGWIAHEPGAVNNIPNVDKAKWCACARSHPDMPYSNLLQPGHLCLERCSDRQGGRWNESNQGLERKGAPQLVRSLVREQGRC